jgi:hypothetical protein
MNSPSFKKFPVRAPTPAQCQLEFHRMNFRLALAGSLRLLPDSPDHLPRVFVMGQTQPGETIEK